VTPTPTSPPATPTATRTSPPATPTPTPTATPTPAPCGAGCTRKTTGGGEINVSNGVGSFGFVVQGGPSGQLEYQNHAQGVNVHSVSITSFSTFGNNATFSGTCTKNGAACNFTVTVQDNGEPGKGVDKFTISVDSGPTEGGTITKGNVQIH
jgi:hypothetical protein